MMIRATRRPITDPDESLPSPFLLGSLLLRYRRLIVGIVLASMLLVIVAAFLVPASYTSSASFTPTSSESSISRASSLSAQFGLYLGASSNEASPAFYADLVLTRAILEPVLKARYEISEAGKGRSATLLQLYGLQELPEAKQIEHGLAILRREITAAPELRTGVVNIAARTKWPEVSEGVIQRILDGVSEFNVNKLRSQAAAQRDFGRARLDAASAELLDAENQLLGFLQSNREYRNSPILTFQEDRFARQVALKQQLVTSLTQLYEQARIDAIRDTPVLTVIESPHRAAEPDRRRVLSKVLLANISGLLVGIFLAGLHALLNRARGEDPSSYAAFESLKKEASAELRRLTFGLWRG